MSTDSTMDTERRDMNFKIALELEREIRMMRSLIEHPANKLKSEAAIVVTIVNIRAKIVELGQKIDLAVAHGIDPQRTEVLRIKAHFGHYWEH